MATYGLDVGPTDEERAGFAARVVSLLERCKSVSDGLVGFDDMVWLPVVLGLPVRKFDRVFVDETQDLNPAQFQLALRASFPDGGRICAVGDDRQAIYGFRGADEEALPRVIRDLGATVFPLSVTYRCARSIVDEVRSIVPDLEAAPDAEAGEVHRFDDPGHARVRAEARPGDFVLSRTNAPLVSMCLSFLREGRRASILGRDLGAQLVTIIRKSSATSVRALRIFVEEWRDAEVERLTKKDPPPESAIQVVEDKALVILELSDGVATVADVLGQIESLFAEGEDDSRITLSTTHKAKGLERDRVFLLAETYRRRPTTEEDNLYYVACTRAKRQLFLSRDLPKSVVGVA